MGMYVQTDGYHEDIQGRQLDACYQLIAVLSAHVIVICCMQETSSEEGMEQFVLPYSCERLQSSVTCAAPVIPLHIVSFRKLVRNTLARHPQQELRIYGVS
jgi:hypothetical protein